LTIYIILFVTGAVAGIINVTSAGGSMLTLPALIFSGLDSVMANGTNRVAILFQSIVAAKQFKDKGILDIKGGLKLATVTVPGAVLGSIFAVSLSDAMFKKILACVLIMSVVTLFMKKPKVAEQENTKMPPILYPIMFAIGFYGGFVQVGVGFFLMAGVYSIMKISLVKVNTYKVFLILIYTSVVLPVFIYSGKIDWIAGLVLAAGNSTGAYIGAQMTFKGGDKLIKWVTAFAVVVMSVKLFF